MSESNRWVTKQSYSFTFSINIYTLKNNLFLCNFFHGFVPFEKNGNQFQDCGNYGIISKIAEIIRRVRFHNKEI